MLNNLFVRIDRHKQSNIFYTKTRCGLNRYTLSNALFRRKPITYTNNLDSIKHFVDSSVGCRQFVRIDCKDMSLSSSGSQFGYLIDRDNNIMSYFGDGPINGEGKNLEIYRNQDSISTK